jgi:hypothetical protein
MRDLMKVNEQEFASGADGAFQGENERRGIKTLSAWRTF